MKEYGESEHKNIVVMRCYIVIYYGVLCNISILCWNTNYVRLQ